MSTFEFLAQLLNGDTGAWIIFGFIVGTVAFFALYQKITGESFVKSKKERREVSKRRYFVLWEFEREN